MKEKKGEHPFGDSGQLILLAVFLIVWIADSFFLKKSTHLSESIPLGFRLVFLALAAGTGLAFFKSAHWVVRHEERPDHVVSDGAFRWVRHPLYGACLLIYLGLAVSTASLISLALFFGIWGFYGYIAGYEEKLLEARFGDAYRTYKEKTGKWIPKLRG